MHATLSALRGLAERAGQEAHQEAARYSDGEARPLAGYLVAMGSYAGLLAGLAGLSKATGRRLPERFSTSDLSLLAVATYKGARLLAKDPVTSPLRAPFTVFRGRSGEAELAEEARPGARHSAGELLSCPFCLGQWIATLLAFGLVLAPRTTRFAASILAVRGGADALQFAYSALQQAAT